MPLPWKPRRSSRQAEESAPSTSMLARQGSLSSSNSVFSRTFMAKMWHVFTTMPLDEEGRLKWSKAKALTQHMATAMQLGSGVLKHFEGQFPQEHYSQKSTKEEGPDSIEESSKGGITFYDYQIFLKDYFLTQINTVEALDDIFVNSSDQVQVEKTTNAADDNNEGHQEPSAQTETIANLEDVSRLLTEGSAYSTEGPPLYEEQPMIYETGPFQLEKGPLSFDEEPVVEKVSLTNQDGTLALDAEPPISGEGPVTDEEGPLAPPGTPEGTLVAEEEALVTPSGSPLDTPAKSEEALAVQNEERRISHGEQSVTHDEGSATQESSLCQKDVSVTHVEETKSESDQIRFQSESLPSMSPFLPDEANRSVTWEFVDQICWTLFSKQALSPHYFEQFSKEALDSLWLWFTTFSDVDEDGIVACPVVMDIEELNYWFHFLFSDRLALSFESLEYQTPKVFTYIEVLDAVISLKEKFRINKEELMAAIFEFSNDIFFGIMGKGYQMIKGSQYKTKFNLKKLFWKRRYCVLSLKYFSLYSDEKMADLKEQIPLHDIVSADPYRDRDAKQTLYQVETKTGVFIIEAQDLRDRNRWIRDIQFALRCIRMAVENTFIFKAEERRKKRLDKRLKDKMLAEEKQMYDQQIAETQEANEKLNKVIENVKDALQREEQQRIAEEQRREELTKELQQRLENVTLQMNATVKSVEEEKEKQHQELEMERRRVAELQTMRQELEAALKEQQRLRKEEEVVMRKQASLAEEQSKARERLEQMKDEKDQLLDIEIQRRANIEIELQQQKEKITQSEQQLNEYINQLKDSELQKSELFEKMKELEEKMKRTSEEYRRGAQIKISHRGAGFLLRNMEE